MIGFSNIEDTIGNTINIGAQCNWWNYVDSVQFRQVAQTLTSTKDSMLVTKLKVSKLTFKDTLWHGVIFNEMGTKTIKAMAYLSNGSIISDSITVIIYPKQTTDDMQPPVIRLLSPPDSAIVTASSWQVKIICKDQSGIAFVKCFVGQDSFHVTNTVSIYSATIGNLVHDRVATIMFISSDASPHMNKDTLFAHVKYDSIPIKNDSNLTLWYNGNGNTGGTIPVDSVRYQTGAKVTIKANTGNLVKTGFTFAEWNTSADGIGTSYAPGAIFIMGTTNDTLFARWTSGPTYTISYKGNSNTGGIVPVDSGIYESGTKVTVKANTGSLVKAGSTFAGWNTKDDGSGVSYAPSDTITMGASNVTLYAKWSTDAYTITYNLNGGINNASNPATYNITISAIILANPAKAGYTFAGWYENSGLTGIAVTSIPAGSTGDKAFWVKWSTDAYTITYNLNGGTNNATNPATYNTTTSAITLADPDKIGYSFGGWYENSGLTGTMVTSIPSGSTGPKVFWAKWTAANYSITYNLNSGTNGSNPSTYTIVTPTITLAGPSRTGYDFGGWYDNSGFSGTAVTSIPLGSSGNKEFWVKWTATTYNITYNLNSGTNGNNPSTYTTATPTIMLAVPSRSGYDFGGWYDNSGFSGSAVTSIPLGSSGNKEFWVKWTATNYSIAYNNLGGGTNGGNPSSYTIATANIILANASRNGYDFNAWYDNPSFSGSPVTSIPQGSTSTKAFWAKWTPISYSIIYHLNGGTNGSNPSGFTIESSIINLNGASKASYIFEGWYDNEGLTGSKIASISSGSTGNREYWVKWIITDIDGNVYTEVKIGNQVWMVENLMTTHYNDGSSIPLITDETVWNRTTHAYCWYGNNASNKIPYGALYNWYTVDHGNLAPAGWHVASYDEWELLLQNTGGYSAAGGKLKEISTAHWNSPNQGAVNEFGFTALPGGWRDFAGVFSSMGSTGDWWTATAYPYNSTEAWEKRMFNNNTDVSEYDIDKRIGMSVRCVRN